MRPCYFWISVTFAPCNAYVTTAAASLVIIKHIACRRRCRNGSDKHVLSGLPQSLCFQCISQRNNRLVFTRTLCFRVGCLSRLARHAGFFILYGLFFLLLFLTHEFRSCNTFVISVPDAAFHTLAFNLLIRGCYILVTCINIDRSCFAYELRVLQDVRKM